MSDIRLPPAGYVRNEDLFTITYIYVIFGAITLFLNLPLAIYLLKTIGKYQKELIIMIALSISDIICAAQFLGMGIYRFFVWFEDVYFISQAACNRNVIVASFQLCIQLDNFFSLIIALDRLFAVLFPVRYNKCGLTYTCVLVATPMVASIAGYTIHLIIISLLPATYVDQICFNFSTVLPIFRSYLSYQRMLCVFIPTLIYFFIYFRMKFKVRKIGNSHHAPNKGMRNLTKTVAYITLASFFLVFIPEAWFTFKLFGGMDASIYFTFILLKKIVTFFIHTIRHRELMKHIEKFLPRKITNLLHNPDTQSHSAVLKVKAMKEVSQQNPPTMRSIKD